ncbi:MAG: DUF4097 family beta strand repeat-containing protein [Ktedonobacterales bacterium]
MDDMAPRPAQGEPTAEERATQASAEANAPAQPAIGIAETQSRPRSPYPPVPTRYAEVAASTRRRGAPWFVWLLGGCLAVAVIAVLVAALAAGLIGGLAYHIANQPTVTQQSSQIFTVSGAPTVVVRNSAGQITVTAGAADQVTAQVTKHARDSSQSQAQHDLDSMQVTLTQSGNTIIIETNYDTPSSNGFFGQQRTVDLAITVPPTASITANDAAGTINLQGVTGLINATNSAGSIHMGSVTLNDGSSLTDNAGSIEGDLALASGAAVTIQNNAGSIDLQLPASTATHLDAHANAGNITISGWPITVSHDVASASASGDTAAGASGTLTIRDNAGSITLMAQ